MIKINRILEYFLIVLIIVPSTLNAWESVGWENHRHITDDVIRNLGVYEYPDLEKYRGEFEFGNGVVEGSSDESSHDERWRGPEQTWRNNAETSYNSLNFYSAYNYLGYVIHLLQDDQVPAHMDKCAHGFWLFNLIRRDNLETFANTHHQYNWETSTNWGNDDEEGHFWQYWLSDDYDDDDYINGTLDQYDDKIPDGPDAFHEREQWGTYGKGTYLIDPIPGNDEGEDWYNGSTKDASIAYEQLSKSYDKTKNELIIFSKSRKPFIKDLNLSLHNGYVDTESGSEISFQILENRKQTVKIFMTLDSPDGPPIIHSGYGTGYSYNLFTGSQLPWEGVFTVKWHGQLADGTKPSAGQHTLFNPA